MLGDDKSGFVIIAVDRFFALAPSSIFIVRCLPLL
jgi:hypothetical protein